MPLSNHLIRRSNSPGIVGLISDALTATRQCCRAHHLDLRGLSKFILFGKRHLDHIIAEFVEYYNTARSPTEREHLPPVRVAIPEEIPDLPRDDITVRSYVGGLVKSFERKAA